MSFDEMVLRALLRLARRRQPATEGALALRSGRSRRDVRGSLRRLEACGLVERCGAGAVPRLTMTGLALAVAALPRPLQEPAVTARAWRAA